MILKDSASSGDETFAQYTNEGKLDLASFIRREAYNKISSNLNALNTLGNLGTGSLPKLVATFITTKYSRLYCARFNNTRRT